LVLLKEKSGGEQTKKVLRRERGKGVCRNQKKVNEFLIAFPSGGGGTGRAEVRKLVQHRRSQYKRETAGPEKASLLVGDGGHENIEPGNQRVKKIKGSKKESRGVREKKEQKGVSGPKS